MVLTDPVETLAPETAIKRGRGRPRISSKGELEKIAVELFTKRGYQKTTIDDVAEAARVSRSTVFRYVNTKNQLLWLFAGDYLEALEKALNSDPEDGSITRHIQEALVTSMSLPISEADIFRKKLKIIESDEEQLSASLAYKLQAAKVITETIYRLLPKSKTSLATNGIGHAYLAAAFEGIFHWAASTSDPDALPDVLREMFTALNTAYDEFLKQFNT